MHVLKPIGVARAKSGLGISHKQDNRVSPDGAEEDTCPVGLTAREAEILQLLAAGLSTQEMVRLLRISEDTVRTHIRNILNKLNAHSRLQAVCLAIRHRLI